MKLMKKSLAHKNRNNPIQNLKYFYSHKWFSTKAIRGRSVLLWVGSAKLVKFQIKLWGWDWLRGSMIAPPKPVWVVGGGLILLMVVYPIVYYNGFFLLPRWLFGISSINNIFLAFLIHFGISLCHSCLPRGKKPLPVCPALLWTVHCHVFQIAPHQAPSHCGGRAGKLRKLC